MNAVPGTPGLGATSVIFIRWKVAPAEAGISASAAEAASVAAIPLRMIPP